MKIALTMRVTNAADYHEPRDSLSHDWLDTLVAWGATAYPVPNIGANAVDYVQLLMPDAIIFTGGESPGTSPRRDATERALLDHVLAHGLPALGVCRGLQFINAALGGCNVEVTGHFPHPHSVVIRGAMKDLFGQQCLVNSYHTLAIVDGGLADDLEPFAVADDGSIEGVLHRNRPLAAVMWHPERVGAPNADRTLFDYLLARGHHS